MNQRIARERKPAVCFTFWFRQHNNPRYAMLFPYLEPVVEFKKVMLSDRRFVRGIQFRLWKAFRRKVIYPAAAQYLARLYPTVFTVDICQVPAWPGTHRLVIDMDDPIFSQTEFDVLRLPQVKAIVVTTERAKEIYRRNGISCPIHVIPQGISLEEIDETRIREISATIKEREDIVVGYHAPTLTLACDGPRRARGGQDDLDFLFGALEQARREEPRLKLWLFGQASESVKRYASDHSDWVKAFGYVALSDMLNYVSNFDIGVYPRAAALPPARFSVKLAQFMACGVPIVSTNLDESCLLSETGSGIICESKATFSQALVQLALSQDKRAALGQAGRRYAAQNLDWSLLVRTYKEILGGRR